MCRTATRVSSVNRSVSDGMGKRAIVSLLLIHHCHPHLPIGLPRVLLASGSGLGIACPKYVCRQPDTGDAVLASLAREGTCPRALRKARDWGSAAGAFPEVAHRFRCNDRDGVPQTITAARSQ